MIEMENLEHKARLTDIHDAEVCRPKSGGMENLLMHT